MFFVGTDNSPEAPADNNFAVFTADFYAGFYFHLDFPFYFLRIKDLSILH